MSLIRVFFLSFILLTPLVPACTHAAKVDASKKNQDMISSQNKSSKPSIPPALKVNSSNKNQVKMSSFNKHRGGLIIVDPGHGGFDRGAACFSCVEKTLTLSTAQMIKKYLNALGYKVVMTRTRDNFISLKKRASIANTTNAKLFLSVHYNSAKSTSASGIEVFYYDSKNKWKRSSSEGLAKNILSEMIQSSGAVSRGVKMGNFHVLRESRMPSVLIEGGFITNQKERDKLLDIKYQEMIAKSIADGVDSYLKSL
ncbi:MAG: N-acetylmuramoyl-L-alanine amidase [Simkaniaceae bacterium]|nr:N-acetylmuramoyl-L-alanine amidase [Simkaniaceae bacterium]